MPVSPMLNRKLVAILGIIFMFLSAAQASSLSEMKDRTAFMATRYLQIWSSDNTSPIAEVPRMYGPTVLFYGQQYTQADLIAEKRQAIRRWPIRRYFHRPGTLEVRCNAAEQRCIAQSTIDFSISNPSRRLAKAGSAKFDLGVSFAESHPIILFEGGSLNSRPTKR